MPLSLYPPPYTPIHPAPITICLPVYPSIRPHTHPSTYMPTSHRSYPPSLYWCFHSLFKQNISAHNFKHQLRSFLNSYPTSGLPGVCQPRCPWVPSLPSIWKLLRESYYLHIYTQTGKSPFIPLWVLEGKLGPHSERHNFSVFGIKVRSHLQQVLDLRVLKPDGTIQVT